MGPLPTDPGKHFAMELLDTQVFFGERSGIGPFVGDVLESWTFSVKVKTLELPYDEEIRLAVTGWSGTRWGLPATEGAIGFDGVKSNSWVVVY